MDSKQLNLLKELRGLSGISMSLCKKVLEECDWDIIKAQELLKEECLKFASKKLNADTPDGAVIIASIDNIIYGTIIRCQTDFVAKSKDFSIMSQKVLNTHIN